jgi:hypothetical protein
VIKIDGDQADRMPINQVVATGLLALLCAAIALTAYYITPTLRRPHQAIWLRLIVSMVVFAAALAHELNSVRQHRRPIHRAAIALAVVLPLFVIMFSWIYLTLSRSNPANFGGTLTRTEALYFTITVLTTVGFGDIVPKTDTARLVTASQMVTDLLVLAVVVRLIVTVATRAVARQRAQPESPPG